MSPALPAVPPPAPADHPRRDRIVAVAFFVILLLPALALVWTAGRTVTRFENRPMAPWPAAALSRDFPQAFERAFADRFGGRDELVVLHHAGKLALFGVSSLPNVLAAGSGWYYWLGEDGKSLARHYRGSLAVPQSEIDGTVRELLRRRAWLASLGIAYVVMVVPDKFTIYPEHLPAWIRPAAGPSPHDRLTAAMAAHPELTFLDLRPALREAKARELVYYKTDSHWNYNGAVVGYERLMAAVNKVLPGKVSAPVPAPRPPYTPGVDYYRGDLLHMLGRPPGVREDDIAPLGKVLGDAAGRCARRADKNEFPGFEFYVCDKPGLPRAVVLRDSMAIPLIPLLSENFARVVYAGTRTLDRALIQREKPDIVIEEFVERSLHAPGAFPMDPP